MACCFSYKFGQQGLLEPENPRAASKCNPFLCLTNVIATPFLLLWHSVRIYVLPCIYVMLTRLGCFFCASLGIVGRLSRAGGTMPGGRARGRCLWRRGVAPPVGPPSKGGDASSSSDGAEGCRSPARVWRGVKDILAAICFREQLRVLNPAAYQTSL